MEPVFRDYLRGLLNDRIGVETGLAEGATTVEAIITA